MVALVAIFFGSKTFRFEELLFYMHSTYYSLGKNRFELLTDGEIFLGIGKVWINDSQVRSGRLPLRPYSESFIGAELQQLNLVAVNEAADELRIIIEATFKESETKQLRDHSLDPIHETGDWDTPAIAGHGIFTLIIRPAHDSFAGVEFDGFSYHYQYDSDDLPLYYIIDKASWEINGNITGSTVYNQSACSDPVVTFADETAWATEGVLFFLVEQGNCNPVMTHNLPRWADHQWFDFQFNGDITLIGVYQQVNLIRSLLKRDAGRAELKHFDKHIFDETLHIATTPKAILINTTPKKIVDQQNIWSWIFEDTSQRARAEYGLHEVLPIPFIGHHYWTNCSIDSSYKDILPAAINIGAKLIFAENFKKSDASEPNPLISGNMCCSHEYEISEYKGGTKKFKEYIDRCHRHGIKNHLWTNTYVSFNAQINKEQRAEPNGWYMAMEDTRTKYAGAYTVVSSNLDLREPAVFEYYRDAHKKIVDETGLDGYFIDSHYNLFFMPVNYKTGHPRTSWKESLYMMSALQDAGVEWSIESFGPFGMNIHGHVDSYDISKVFICYNIGLGNNYATVPVPGIETDKNVNHAPEYIFYQLAHKCPCQLPLFIDGKRIDEVYGEEHRRILREYHDFLPDMNRRFLQQDGLAVIWHNSGNTQAIIWNFTDRRVELSGTVIDLSSGEILPKNDSYRLEKTHMYSVADVACLPTELFSKD